MTRALVDASALYPNFQAEKKKQLARISSSALATKKEKNGSASVSSTPVPKPSRITGFWDVRPVTVSESPIQRPTTEQHQRALEKQPRTLAPVTARRGSVRASKSIMSNVNQREDALEHPKDASEAQHENEHALESAAGRPTRVRAARDVAIRGDLDFLPSGDHPQLLLHGDTSGWASITRPRTSASVATPLLGPASLSDVALSARPRSRFARRDSARWPNAPRALERIATAPSLKSVGLSDTIGDGSDDGGGSVSLAGNRSAVELSSIHRRPATTGTTVSVVASVAMPTAWDESDVANFFLTEIDKATADVEAAKQRKENKQRLASIIADASYLLYGLQQLEPAVARLADAVALAEHLKQQQGDGNHYEALVGLLHHHAGIALKDLGRAKFALAAQRRCLETALHVQDRRLQARAVKALGVLLLDAHDVKSALEHQQEALAIAIEEKDRELEARVYANLGNLAAAQMRFGHAIACHERDLTLSQSPALNSAVGAVRAHRNLAVVYGRLHKRGLQQKHEAQARELEEGARAFEADLEQHVTDGVGNLACQLSSRDDELVEMVASAQANAAEERRRGQHQGRRRSSSDFADAGGCDRSQSVVELRRERSASGFLSLDASSEVEGGTEGGIDGCRTAGAEGEAEPQPRRPNVTLRIDNYPLG